MVYFIKTINLALEFFIWIGLWKIYDNILERFTLSNDRKLVIYIITIIFAFTMIYLVNDELGYKYTLYGPN